MAYLEYYRIRVANDLRHDVDIFLSKLDGAPVDLVTYHAEAIKLTRDAEEKDVFACLIGSLLEVSFDVNLDEYDPWDDFVNAGSRTWKVIATIDGQYVFHGFVMPDECQVAFQDRPITITLRASDGIGQLKQQLLSDYYGAEFIGKNIWIDYVCGAIKKLDLDLDIRIIDNVYHDSMFTRDTDITNDCFNQAKLESRTFDKDGNDLLSCYDALRKILYRSHRLYYQNGEIVIKRLSMFQYTPGDEYYTLYAPDGVINGGFIETENHAEVGVDQMIYPCNENQLKTAKPAYKTVKTNYKYEIWDEIPRNNRFERGVIITDTPALKEYEIDDWEHGTGPVTLTGTNQPALGATAKILNRTEELNAYGVVLENYVKMETDAASTIWMRSEGVPVNKGDKFTLSFSFRSDVDFSTGGGGGVYEFASVYILKTDGTRWGLSYSGGWVEGTVGSVGYDVDDSIDTRDWLSVSVESYPLPVDGTLYIALKGSQGLSFSTYVYWKNFVFDYRMYVAGGFLPVKGDYWSRSQADYFDKAENEVYLSDSLISVAKGAIFSNTDYLTTPEWYRFGHTTEQRHYKELTNIGEYNLLRKRFWMIEGSFTGLKYAPANDPASMFPLSMGKIYRFMDAPLVAGYNRDFILVPPLEMDLMTGEFIGRFAEVKNAADDGTLEGDSSEFKYTF